MAKILLVEDDNNLREIYGERLMAEGYDIVSASDGEEALQTAVTEKPDLIISDVMMPKISGFDMLDILRQTPETKDVKIIMMTALSQAEDKTRADKLGADKYLVKSQVTLEDVARVVHDLLGDGEEEPAEVDASSITNEPNQTDQATVSEEPIIIATPPEVQPIVQNDENTGINTNEISSNEPIATQEAPELVLPASQPPAATQIISEATQAPVVQTIVTPSEPPAADQVAQEQIAPDPSQASTVQEQPAIVTPSTPLQASFTPTAPPEPIATPVVQEPSLPTSQPNPIAEPTNPITTPVDPVTSAQQNPATAPIVNPISSSAIVTDEPASDVTSTVAQDAESEISEIAQQIEQFAATAPEAAHPAPVHEPTQQEIIHAQNAADEPTIVSAQGTVNTPAQTVPPITPVPTQGDPANPEPASSRKKIIQPVSTSDSTPNIHELYEQEMAREAANSPVVNPSTGTVIESNVPEQSTGAQNPFEATPNLNDAAPPPLETLDPTQINGVYGSEDEAQAAAMQTQPNATALSPQQQASVQPQPQSQNPADPNNIAL